MSRRLLLALACSLLLHVIPFVADLIPQPQAAKRPPPNLPPLQAKLQPPPAPPAPAQPELMLPEPPKPEKAEPPKPAKPEKRLTTAKPGPRKAATWQDEIRRQFSKLNDQGKFYPIEAVAAGLEGEALVLIILDEAGNVVAARLEHSSGQRILDEAAVRNVRSLRSLPAEAPREALLPVRFRLR